MRLTMGEMRGLLKKPMIGYRTGAGKTPKGPSIGMASLAQDARAPLPQWQLHDLRRTARSLMSRASVRLLSSGHLATPSGAPRVRNPLQPWIDMRTTLDKIRDRLAVRAKELVD